MSRSDVVGFEVFDTADVELPDRRPLARVDGAGHLLLNREAWELLRDPRGLSRPWSGSRVHLLFDEAARMAAVRPAYAESGTNVFEVETTRGLDWPRMVEASRFAEHYRIQAGVFWARREVVTRLVAFPVGPPVPAVGQPERLLR
ncbi:hypothetical protein AB0F93_03475 [Micromonospora tulbaghiae]|uniref:hypothetical protein n=1 Tax=Micromonospora tulbaghiae TaxID=479978 RepID=UPI0033258908